ncbi:para-aminobenzoate synthetase/4-amino-4-deoxychorismate lyase [Salirhabdus euzebyi]|uniref:Para-aminobenzoate synthetase/4-amino-4-deoxychorismate lyase n=1 Tax=Salirhabdus euzebyi TaxID=394506 RepID=A0A841Q4Z0_9BACI|nr:aminodeoxychorismate synthase component I [Salirhabdus euzebyi]MBB6453519.1 para-aminobenzoate synthetase/4-amino-4-deoxychorismate lyase [Salirhabdus euzebyi]
MKPHLIFDFANEDGQEQSLSFADPIHILQTDKVEEIPDIFKQVEKALNNNFHVAGYVSYEAAPAFDPAFQVNNKTAIPLVWFGIFDHPSHTSKTTTEDKYEISNWKSETNIKNYEQSLKKIKEAIEEGFTYQVNFTSRLHAHFSGNDRLFYEQLKQNQASSYSAYLNTGRFRILSASPELFFRVKDGRITTKPMKGTAQRGFTLQSDNELANRLQLSEKERAENLMIVDLLRNDIGRIAKTGTVQVPKLFEVETYPTVHQMTSTIEADLEDNLSVYDWFQALFPCGSITGAPKISTMKYIANLESSARNVYCGAIGYIKPNREAVFNVPIRTVLIDTETNQAVYGVGGGITWDSTVEGEYEELLTKAKLLTANRPVFQLLESLRLENGKYPLLAYHLKRLEDSAKYFQFPLKIEKVKVQLETFANQNAHKLYKIRLLVSESGELMLESQDVKQAEKTVVCTISKIPVDMQNPFLYHKTTYREFYNKHMEGMPSNAYSALLWNEREELTEFITGNLVVAIDGKLYTPPVKSGLLAGTFRQSLLDKKIIQEKILLKKDLPKFDQIWFVNSVRGWIEVEHII